MEDNLRIYKKLVDQKYELIKVLKKATGNNYHVGGSVYCPFHDNVHTPAASIYENEGIQSLWCFSEQKLYKASDAFELLLNKNPYELGKALWDEMTLSEQEEWLIENHEYQSTAESFDTEETVDENQKKLDRAFELFKYNKISFKELKKEISNN